MWSTWSQELDRSFAVLDEMRREMDRLFDGLHQTYGGLLPSSTALGAWPRLAVYDEADSYQVLVPLPGYREKDIRLSFDHDTLTIEGERADDAPEGWSAHWRERGAARFHRSLTLPQAVAADRADAKLRHGVLELTLPKVHPTEPKQIPVQASS